MLFRLPIAVCFMLLSAGAGGDAWAAKVGNQFRANTFIGSQDDPAAAGLTNGGVVITWTSEGGQDGSLDGVYGQRYSTTGARVGVEFKVNTYTNSYQSFPSVAGLGNGGFVVVWHSETQDAGSAGVYGQRYSPNGQRFGNEFRVNTYRIGNPSAASVAALSNGGFVVAWVSNGQDGDLRGIYAQRYSSTGSRAGTEFRANTYTSNSQDNPSVAALSGGGFIITWTSTGQDGDGLGVYGQLYNANGVRTGGEIPVTTQVVGDQSRSSVAGDKSGGFIITWTGRDLSSTGVFAQRFRSTGARIGSNFRVNTYTNSFQDAPSIAALNNGGFVVIWESEGQDSSGYGVFCQRYSATGARIGGGFRVNTSVLNNQIEPVVAPLTDGGFVVSWRLHGGAQSGIFGQRFGP